MKKILILALVLCSITACKKKDPNAPENNTLLPDKVAQELQEAETITQVEPSANDQDDARNALLALVEEGGENLYVNSEFGFEVTKPADWEKQEGQLGTLVSFMAPENSEEIFRPNINIVVQTLTQEIAAMNLDEYMEMSVAEIEPYFDEINIIENENVPFYGINSKRIVFEVETQGQTLQLGQRIWFDQGRVYVITFTAGPGQFERDLEAFNLVQNTFRNRQ